MSASFPVTAYSLCNALGMTTSTVVGALRRGASGLRPCALPLPFDAVCGALPEALPALPHALQAFDTRQARLLQAVIQGLEGPLQAARQRWGADRIGVALGTSTAGIAQTELAYESFKRLGRPPENYQFVHQHPPDAMLRFLAATHGFAGPAVVVSTACSSSVKVFGVARRWLELDLCDAVLIGGIDTLCQLTLRGFKSLDLLSAQPCQPFSASRAGLNLGEGGALLLLEREGNGPARLLGVGETSDAYHMTAPHPDGIGAIAAMGDALQQAGLAADQVDHINAHGTGSQLNDAVEGLAIAQLFGDHVPVSATKGYTGHLLGAAGATEAAFAVASIEHGFIPASLGSAPQDPTLGIQISHHPVDRPVHVVLSNSFAFGGNNVSVVFAGGK